MTTTESNTVEISAEEQMQLEYDTEMFTYQKKLYEDLKALKDNPHFQSLIETAYVEKAQDAAVTALVQATKQENRDTSNLHIYAIGHFKDWMKAVEVQGDYATRSLEQIAQTNYVVAETSEA